MGRAGVAGVNGVDVDGVFSEHYQALMHGPRAMNELLCLLYEVAATGECVVTFSISDKVDDGVQLEWKDST